MDRAWHPLRMPWQTDLSCIWKLHTRIELGQSLDLPLPQHGGPHMKAMGFQYRNDFPDCVPCHGGDEFLATPASSKDAPYRLRREVRSHRNDIFLAGESYGCFFAFFPKQWANCPRM